MTQVSHLSPGFRFAGALSSVAVQRVLQGVLLSSYTVESLLVVGSGFGEEADVLVRHLDEASPPPFLTAIDLANVSHSLREKPNLGCLGARLQFQQTDLLETSLLKKYGEFDVVQCGFVLHDFPPDAKDAAVTTLAAAVRSGGYVLISDIFLLSPMNAREVWFLYQGFLQEATAALQLGRLTPESFDALVGDGVRMGLARSLREAIRGERDYFETREALINRALRAGLEIVRVDCNPMNKRMSTLLFRRPRVTRRYARVAVGANHVI